MFYLLYIFDNGEPGRMYGPTDWETCKQKMIQFLKEDEGIEISNEEAETGHYYPVADDIAGWHIIQAEAFE